MSGVRYLVLLWLCLLSLIVYVHRNSLGVVEKEIRTELGISPKAMGLVMGMFFFTYAAGQIPGGVVASRFGSRRPLPALCAVGSAATAVLGLAAGLPLLLFGRLVQGGAQAGMFPCATAIFARWFPITQRAFASGMLAAFMSIGGALGASLTGWLTPETGWRWLFVLYALPGFVWAGGFYYWFRDRPSDHPAVLAAELAVIGDTSSTEPRLDEPTPWAQLLTSPALACICGQQFLRAAGYMFYSSWFTTFLREAHEVSLQEAGVLTSMPLLGVVFGSLAGGVSSDWILAKTGSRRLGRQGVAAATCLVSGALILVARMVTDTWGFVLIIGAGAFFVSMAAPCAYAITIDMGGRHVAPVFATMNMSGNIGALLFPVVVPWLVGTEGNWDLVLWVFAAIHFAAAACWMGLNPNGTIVPAIEEDPCLT